jgi:[acyl-carrier-protein] S-malonyltransferase
MAAILGIQPDLLVGLCAQVSKPDHQVIVANYNSPSQYVISGHHAAVKEVMTLATAQGAKRAIPLNVSGAFHSPLMATAGDALAAFLPTIMFKPATTPMIFNWTAKPLPNLTALPEHLIQQVQSSVKFEASIRYLHNQGILTFLEIGPGNVLAGLVKKIVPEASVVSYNGIQDLPLVKELIA